MRLIDADALIEEIKSLQVFVTGLRAGKGVLNEYAKQYRESLLRIVYEQSTVYDISKVVEELEEMQVKAEKDMQLSDNVAEANAYGGMMLAYGLAIPIVEKGGVE